MGIVRRLIRKIVREVKYVATLLSLFSKLFLKFGVLAALILSVGFGATLVVDDIGSYAPAPLNDDRDDRTTSPQPPSQPSPESSTDTSSPETSNIDLSTEPKNIAGRSYNEAEIEEALTRKINNYRQENGKPPLETHPEIRMLAREYSKDMATRNFYSHTNPEGITAHQRIGGLPYCRTASENIEKSYLERRTTSGKVSGQQEAIDYIFNEWKNSPSHNRNMLRSGVKYSGIGVYIEDHDSYADIYSTHELCF